MENEIHNEENEIENQPKEKKRKQSKPSKRGKRGHATLENLRAKKTKGDVLELEFDDKGIPSGNDVKHYGSYLGYIARDRVSCVYKEWEDVPKQHLDAIWDNIKEFWNFKNDNGKENTLIKMGALWKHWKCTLRAKYIYKNSPTNPWDDYNITKEDWEEFEQYTNSSEFKVKSEIGKKNAAKNTAPHRMGSAGYIGSMMNWDDNIVLKSSDTSSGVTSECRTTWNYLMARAVLKDGAYVIPEESVKAMEILKAVESMSEEIHTKGIQERYALSTAIGTPEHPGRVRGHDGYKSLKNVFTRKPRKKFTDQEFIHAEIARQVKEALEKREKDIDAEFEKRVDQKVEKKMEEFFSNQLNLPLEKLFIPQSPQAQIQAPSGSCHSTVNPILQITVSKPCNLLMYDDNAR